MYKLDRVERAACLEPANGCRRYFVMTFCISIAVTVRRILQHEVVWWVTLVNVR